MERVERWAVSAALGLAALAHLGLLLGFAGLLRPWPVLGLVLAVSAVTATLAAIVRLGRTPSPGAFSWKWVLLGASALVPSFLLALYPPTGFDATMYHLPFARAFAATGGVPFLPDLRFPVFPQANEMLFAFALLFAPDVATHLVQWLLTLLTAVLIGCWAWEAWGGAAGLLASAVYLGNPLVAHLASSAYVEAGLTLFVTAALYALRRWRQSGEQRWLAASAFFVATAADVKYLGLFFVGALGVAVLAAVAGQRPSPALRSRCAAALLFGGIALATLAPWYGRIWATTGNPLFPFFPRVFGTTAWSPRLFQGLHSWVGGASPGAGNPAAVMGSRLVRTVRLPWDLVLERDRYGKQPPLSPVYLAALPLALWAARSDPRLRRLLGLAGLYAFLCLGLPADSRYLVPVLPLVSLAAAGALVVIVRRRWIAGLALVCLLPGWLYPGYRMLRQGPLPLTPSQREAYLARRLPLYPAIAYLNRTAGSGYTAFALNAENLPYYAQGRWLGDWTGRVRFDHVLANLRGPEDLHRRLTALGADYFVWPRRSALVLPLPEDAAFRRWFQPVFADAHARVYRLSSR
jgi:hypothetical protein